MTEEVPTRPGRAGASSWPRPLRRTIRVRLALLFFAAFLASGAALLAVTFEVWQGTNGNLTATATPVPTEGNPASGVTEHSSDRHQLLIASGIALAIMAGVSLAARLAGGWAVPAAAAHDHGDHAGDLCHQPARASEPRRPRRRAEGAGRHLRRTARPARALVRVRAPLRRQRLSRVAHAACRDADLARRGDGQTGAGAPTLPSRSPIGLRRELDHADRLLESFLTLAHAQHGPLATRRPSRSASSPALAIERRADAISAMGLDVEQRHDPDAWVTGSETLLSRMVENVVDNAVGHNQPGGWIRVITARQGRARAPHRRERRPTARPRRGQAAHPAVPAHRRRADRLGQGRRPGAGDRLLDRRGPRRDARPRRRSATAGCASRSPCPSRSAGAGAPA